MQPIERGYIEQFIDGLLTEEQVTTMRKRFDELAPYVHSVDDAIFGCIYGTLLTGCLDQLLIIRQRGATIEEIQEVRNIILEKIPRIKTLIAKTFT